MLRKSWVSISVVAVFVLACAVLVVTGRSAPHHRPEAAVAPLPTDKGLKHGLNSEKGSTTDPPCVNRTADAGDRVIEDDRALRLRLFAQRFLAEMNALEWAHVEEFNEALHRLRDDLERVLESPYPLADVLRALQDAGPLEYADNVLGHMVFLDDPLREKLLQIVVSKEEDAVRILALNLVDGSSFRFPGEDWRQSLAETMAKEPNDEIRGWLIHMVSREQNDPLVARQLVSMLDYSRERDSDQQTILTALAYSGTSEAAQALKSLLQDSRASDFLKVTVLDRMNDYKKLSANDPDYVWMRPMLLSALRMGSGEEFTQEKRSMLCMAGELLGQAGDFDAVSPLMDTFETAREPACKRQAAYALRWFPRDDVRTRLIAAASNPVEQAEVRMETIRSLGKMLTPNAIASLQIIAQDPSSPASVSSAAKELIAKNRAELSRTPKK